MCHRPHDLRAQPWPARQGKQACVHTDGRVGRGSGRGHAGARPAAGRAPTGGVRTVLPPTCAPSWGGGRRALCPQGRSWPRGHGCCTQRQRQGGPGGRRAPGGWEMNGAGPGCLCPTRPTCSTVSEAWGHHDTPWTLVLRELRETMQEDPSQSCHHARDGRARRPRPQGLGGGPGSRPTGTTSVTCWDHCRFSHRSLRHRRAQGDPGALRGDAGGPEQVGRTPWAPDGITADRPGLRHVAQQGCLQTPQRPLSSDDATPPDSFAAEARECGPGESGAGRPSAQGEGLTDDPDVTVSEPCHPK